MSALQKGLPRRMEPRVFPIGPAITLPPLAIAGRLFARHRRSRWRPFVRGFAFLAVFTSFVELVPYLPSDGAFSHHCPSCGTGRADPGEPPVPAAPVVTPAA